MAAAGTAVDTAAAAGPSTQPKEAKDGKQSGRSKGLKEAKEPAAEEAPAKELAEQGPSGAAGSNKEEAGRPLPSPAPAGAATPAE